ncbi:MAG: hypothetical protein HQL21_04860 [Candidatus Omnitrophica bacterium]|nr:hypothetical protein [Candidatus Omnitrophota bacterium]
MKGIFRSSWMAMIRKAIALIVIAAFSLSPSTTYAQTVLNLPEPGVMVLQSQAFVPVVLRAVKIRPDEPLVFDFVVDNGNTGFEGEVLKREIEKIAKYFLATLTIPQKDLWVNLSPYEKDRIIADEFGQTEMGRDMLAQDYILKQLSSSLVNPDTALGKEYWAKLYAKAQEVLGTTEIPMDTFNKVWIVPEKAVIYEKDNAAILGETHLKLMMEEDYLAMKKSGDSADWAQRISQQASDPNRAAAQVSAQIMREVILPEIEKEVNTGKNFAPLRQMFSAIILATWYKEAVKDSLLSQMYEDKKKIAGVDIQDVNMREKIFEQYVAAYKKGVFDFIRDDQDPVSGDVLPRRYFSGGVNAEGVQKAMSLQKLATVPAGLDSGNFDAKDRTYSAAMIALTRPGVKPPQLAKADPLEDFQKAVGPGKTILSWDDLLSADVFFVGDPQDEPAIHLEEQDLDEMASVEGFFQKVQTLSRATQKEVLGIRVTYGAGKTAEFGSPAPEMAMTKAEVIQNLVQAEREYRAADAQVRALGNASGPDRVAGETARMLAENKLLANSRQLLKLGGLLSVDVLGRELSDLVASIRFKHQEGDASLHHEGIPPGNNFRAEAAMATGEKTLLPPQVQLAEGLFKKKELPARLAYEMMLLLGDSKPLRLDKKEIKVGAAKTFVVNGNEIEIFFADGTSMKFTFDKRGSKVVLDGVDTDLLALMSQAVETVMADSTISDYGYDKRVALQDIVQKIAASTKTTVTDGRFDENISRALGHLNLGAQAIPVDVLKEGPEQFGIIYLNGRVIIEQAFLDRIQQAGNPYDMVTRSFIWALNVGLKAESREDSSIAEFEYALNKVPGVIEKLNKEDRNVVEEYEWLRNDEINDPGRDEISKESLRRMKQHLWRMGLQVLNEDVKKSYFRFSSTDREYDPVKHPEDNNFGRFSWLAQASNPPHWGQLETAYRLMAEEKYSLVGVRTHAYDVRKVLTVLTNSDRQEMMDRFVKRSHFLRFSDVTSEKAGEDDFKRLLELNTKRPVAPDGRKTEVGYIVGTDHLRYEAFDKTGVRIKEPDGKIRPDTVKRFEMMRSDYPPVLRELFIPVPFFNIRAFTDSINKDTDDRQKVQAALRNRDVVLLAGGNIGYEGLETRPGVGVSSTDLRNAFIGIGNPEALSLIPRSSLEFIYTHDRYHGFLMRIPWAFDEVVSGVVKTFNPETGVVDQKALTASQLVERIRAIKIWLERVHQNAKAYSAKEIVEMFSLPKDIPQHILDNANFKAYLSRPDEYMPLTEAVVQRALDLVAAPPVVGAKEVGEKAMEPQKLTDGGIDFYNAAQSMRIERTGKGIKVHVDPAMIQRIQTGGFDGLAPVVIEVIPVRGILPALGMADARGSGTT